MNKKLDRLKGNITKAKNKMYAALNNKYHDGEIVSFMLNCKQLTPSRGIVRGVDGDGYVYIKIITCKKNSRKSVRKIYYDNIV